ncbi:MAG: TolC family protein [Bacteroidia bacterium]
MTPRILAVLIALAGIGNPAWAAAGDTLRLTLKEALSMAEKNNLSHRNTITDIGLAQQKVKEVQSIGLPQVNAAASFNQYVRIPGSYIPNFTGQGPDFIFIAFQQKYAASANIQASWLMYDGTYLLGLRAAKEFVQVSRLLAEKSETDLEQNVTRAYALCLNTVKNLELIDQNRRMLEKNLSDIKEIYAAGFAEKLDVDRLQLSLDNLSVQREKLLTVVAMTQNMLKMAMGIAMDQPIVLTEDLETFEKSILVDGNGDAALQPSARIEHQLLNQTLRLSFYDEKRYKVGYTPTLVGFVTHQRNTNRPEFNFLESNLPINNTWVPATIWGLNLSVPIFDGFRKQSQIRQVQLNRDKTLNQIQEFERFAGMEYINARQSWVTALQAVEVQRKNKDLAERIYEQVNTKFREGVGSTVEILSAETELKNAQIQYLNALYELSLSKIDLKKALGQRINP